MTPACSSGPHSAPVEGPGPVTWVAPWVAPWGRPGLARVGAGQRVPQLPPGTDAELGEHVSQVPLDRPRAEEEPRADLRIGQPVAGEPRDLPLLGGQIVTRLGRPLAHLLARRLKLLTCTLGERLHPDLDQHLVGRAQLLARVDPAVLAA